MSGTNSNKGRGGKIPASLKPSPRQNRPTPAEFKSFAGQILQGRVSRFVSFQRGAILEFNHRSGQPGTHFSGLLHISNVSNAFVERFEDTYLKVGEKAFVRLTGWNGKGFDLSGKGIDLKTGSKLKHLPAADPQSRANLPNQVLISTNGEKGQSSASASRTELAVVTTTAALEDGNGKHSLPSPKESPYQKVSRTGRCKSLKER